MAYAKFFRSRHPKAFYGGSHPISLRKCHYIMKDFHHVFKKVSLDNPVLRLVAIDPKTADFVWLPRSAFCRLPLLCPLPRTTPRIDEIVICIM
jgi:hypothetical protein